MVEEKGSRMMADSEEDDEGVDGVGGGDVIGCAPVHLVDSQRDEITQIIASLSTTLLSEHSLEVELERYRRLLDLYQEQPSLLDPQLESWTLSLINDVSFASQEESVLDELSSAALVFLHHLTKVRGYKAMLRILPHEVKYLEPLLLKLEELSRVDGGYAEQRYLLLLWLLIVSKNPFAFDCFVLGDNAPPVVERIIAICSAYLHRTVDKCQYAAVQLLASTITRPDMAARHLPETIRSSIDAIRNVTESVSSATVVGHLQLLFTIFKMGARGDLLPEAAVVLDAICLFPFAKGDLMVRKLCVKLVQRVGMAFLAPRIATWRYQRGGRSVGDNLNATKTAKSEEKQKQPSEETSCNGCHDEDYDIPQRELEQVLNVVLLSLHDRDTEVRWSSAKGVGRVTSRLPRTLADDVIGSVLARCFRQFDGRAPRHGGCLALAELARRGFLLPQRLPQVMPIIIQEKEGRHALGANVRDAACYCCWAFARAYDPREMQPYVAELAAALVAVALFDREINIRRAASAAFQENVGRQGQFPHGIDIVVAIDFYAVGQRRRCYLEVAEAIARYPEYTRTLMQHLINDKIVHWDEKMRLLAAESLHKLAPLDIAYSRDEIVPHLLRLVDSSDVVTKQGGLFALSHLLASLHECDVDLSSFSSRIAAIPQDMQTICGRKTRSSGGELIRTAMNLFIEKVAVTRLPLSCDHMDTWWNLLRGNSRDENNAVREASSTAASAFFVYFESSPQLRDALRRRCRDELYPSLSKTSVERDRIGSALLLAALSSRVLLEESPSFPHFTADLIDRLITAINSRCDGEANWAEARRASLEALVDIVLKVGINSTDMPRIMACALSALDDYTTDNRGDIGRVLREAGMRALGRLIPRAGKCLERETMQVAIAKMLQQACEKIDHTRQCAAEVLGDLLHDDVTDDLHTVPCYEQLATIFPSSRSRSQRINWLIGSSFDRLAQLLQCAPYFYHVLLGFVISAGGITESVKRAASSALHGFIAGIVSDRDAMDHLLTTLVEIFTHFAGCGRVTMPLMDVLCQLFTKGSFQLYEDDPDESEALTRLVQLTAAEGKGKNPSRSRVAVSVLCGVLQLNRASALWKQALSLVLATLASPFPSLRRSTAEQLYETVVASTELDENLETVLSLLASTEWQAVDRDLDGVRREIAQRLGVVCER